MAEWRHTFLSLRDSLFGWLYSNQRTYLQKAEPAAFLTGILNVLWRHLVCWQMTPFSFGESKWMRNLDRNSVRKCSWLCLNISRFIFRIASQGPNFLCHTNFIPLSSSFLNLTRSSNLGQNAKLHPSHHSKRRFRSISILTDFWQLFRGLGYGITGCGVFKAGVQNWKGFCIKINCSQMKLLNFENWTQ